MFLMVVNQNKKIENLGTDPATAQAICIIFACYSRIMRYFKMYTLGTANFSQRVALRREAFRRSVSGAPLLALGA